MGALLGVVMMSGMFFLFTHIATDLTEKGVISWSCEATEMVE